MRPPDLHPLLARAAHRLAAGMGAWLGAWLALLAPAAAQAQWLDFAQLEYSANATTLVLARALPTWVADQPAPVLTATATRWGSGQALAVAVVPRWALVAGDPAWTVGLGAGLSAWRNRDKNTRQRETAPTLRAQSEWLGPAPGGRYYLLAQWSSFRRAGFGSAQYSLAAWPLALELSHYTERNFDESHLTLRWQPPTSLWSMRLGASQSGGRTRATVGVGYNGF